MVRWGSSGSTAWVGKEDMRGRKRRTGMMDKRSGRVGKKGWIGGEQRVGGEGRAGWIKD